MHPKFAEWYRPLLVQTDDKLLKSRWELVEKYASQLSSPLALDLVRLSFGLPVQDDAAVAAMKQQLKSEDLSYVRATARLELSLIGDFVLLEVLQQSAPARLPTQLVIAGALACQHGVRPTLQRPIQGELFLAARALLDKQAVQVRRPAHVAMDPLVLNPTVDTAEPPDMAEAAEVTIPGRNQLSSFILSVPRMDDINRIAAYVSSFGKAFSGLRWNMAQVADRMNAMTSRIAAVVSAPQEENNVHWYLFGETSRDLSRQFSAFSLAELVPVAAKELADLTTGFPGLYAALAYLDRILGQGRPAAEVASTVSLAELVAAAQPLWQKAAISVPGFDGTQDLTPLLCALAFAVAGNPSWQTLVSELCQVAIDLKLPADRMAYQLYQEILFARLVRELRAPKGVW